MMKLFAATISLSMLAAISNIGAANMTAATEAARAADEAIESCDELVKTQDELIKAQSRVIDKMAEREAKLKQQRDSVLRNPLVWFLIGGIAGGGTFLWLAK